MASIQVTPELMRDTSRQVDSIITEWDGAVRKIYQLVEQMDAMWDGLGNDSFNIVFQNDRPKYNNLNILMADYSRAIVSAANLYDKGEQDVKDIVTRKW